MRSFALSDLGAITHTLALVESEGQTIVVVSFAGVYRDGSAGAPDARLMRAVVAGAVTATDADGVVLDLRELTYRWGNNLLDIFIPVAPGGFRSLSYAVVVSDSCEPAVRSLLADAPLVYRDLDAAVAHAAAGAIATVEREDALETTPLVVHVRDDGPDLADGELFARVAAAVIRAGLAVEESSLVRAWSCGRLEVRVERLAPDAFAARAAGALPIAGVDGAFITLDENSDD